MIPLVLDEQAMLAALDAAALIEARDEITPRDWGFELDLVVPAIGYSFVHPPS